MSEFVPTPEARDRALANAKEAGLEVVYGNAFTLQLDLDSKAETEEAKRMVRHFWDHLRVDRVVLTTSKSGNRHMFVSLKEPMDRPDRLYWQAALGSDKVREGLNWLWFRKGYWQECMLFEVPGAQRRILKRES